MCHLAGCLSGQSTCSQACCRLINRVGDCGLQLFQGLGCALRSRKIEELLFDLRDSISHMLKVLKKSVAKLHVLCLCQGLEASLLLKLSCLFGRQWGWLLAVEELGLTRHSQKPFQLSDILCSPKRVPYGQRFQDCRAPWVQDELQRLISFGLCLALRFLLKFLFLLLPLPGLRTIGRAV